MIISANWLSEYVDHDLPTAELAELLTMAGLEVESVERVGFDAEGVVVGRILSVEDHPNADRLRLCTVDAGGDDPLPIVCGAPNVERGQNVPVARVGATLQLPSRDDPDERTPVTIRKTKIRGEVSQGMICAEDELGLGARHDGILVLDGDAKIGSPFEDYLAERGIEATDHIFDIAITPNRPDAISHIGVARDVAALTRIPLTVPQVNVPESEGDVGEKVTVKIEDATACTRYVGILVEDVEVRESPEWIKRRLEAIGLRPRNNLVDITNYVMHETGQPLHAFDFDLLAGGSIIVRSTEHESTFTTLDDKERTLPADTLMICDADREVAIAGVMGGENSEVSEKTTSVLIESAWFDPSSIRRTAKALQIQTDASYRFERGVDPTGQARAAARAAKLMVELAGGRRIAGMVDVHPAPHQPLTVQLRAERVNSLLGTRVPREDIDYLLTSIGFDLKEAGKGVWDVRVPPFRPDVEREVDVIEEVARLYGFDRIPEPTHSKIPNFTPARRPVRRLRDRGHSVLSGIGFREIYTNSMLSRELARSYHRPSLPGGRPGGEVVETINPITTEMSTLRPTMLPGALRVAAHNQNHGQTAQRFFEFGHVHTRASTDRTIVGDYTEIEALLLAASGHWTTAGWSNDARPVDIFDMKGVCSRLLEAVGIREVAFNPAETDLGRERMSILCGDDSWLGTMGRITPDDAPGFELRDDILFAELDWVSVVEHAKRSLRPQYEQVSRFPVVERDLAVVVDAGEPVGKLVEAVRQSGDHLLLNIEIFDLYEGKGIPENKKSVAFSLRFGTDRTLRDKEVDKSVSAILETLKQQFDAELR